MSKVRVGVAHESRFRIHGLSIAPSLAGAVHKFQVNGRHVEVCLPTKPKMLRSPSDKFEPIWCSSWRLKPRRRPICYEVNSIDIIVDLRARAVVPDDGVSVPLRRNQFGPKEKARLDKLVKLADILATAALVRWTRVMRWKTNRFWIGRPGPTADPKHASALITRDEGRRFYSGPMVIEAGLSNPIPKWQWRTAGAALARGLEPPIWFDFLFDGRYRLASGDLKGGILDLAIASELLIRSIILERHVAKPTNDEFEKLVSLASIARIVDSWRQLGFRSPGWNKAFDTMRIKRLFALRNGLMHRGVAELDPIECRDLGKAVGAFIIYGSRLR